MIPSYLLSDSGCEKKDPPCKGGHPDAVKQDPETNRWYITMGHPGFNSNANNGSGYLTKQSAENSIIFYGTSSRVTYRQVSPKKFQIFVDGEHIFTTYRGKAGLKQMLEFWTKRVEGRP